MIAEYDNGAAVGSPSREYIYSGSALLAKIDSSGTKYYHQDHLSNRMVTDSSGTKLAEMGTFPYGESWYNATSEKLIFTTYERDAESGNDYAQARYNVSGLARFSSPDPIAGSISDPQSLNRYSYVRNMPVMLSDPSGRIPGCTTVRNHAPEASSSDADRTGGPSASDFSADPPPQAGCGGGTPCEYTLAGCAGGFGGPGAAAGLDGGFSGDDSGMAPTFGVGQSPGSIGMDGFWQYVFSGSPNFHWGDYTLDELLDFADQGEISILDVNFQTTSLDPRTIVGGVFGAASGKAVQLALKPDCATFLESVGKAALLAAAGMKPGAPFLPNVTGKYIQSMYDNYSAVEVALTAFGATLDNKPGVDPTEGNAHTFAEISGQNTITTYKIFNNAVPVMKAQTLLHEATHINSGGTDQQLAAAAGVPNAMNMSIAEASGAFQKELQKHCK